MPSRPRLLIVDDEKNQREGYRKLLADTYDVTLADTGEKASDLIFASAFDVVLTDLRMPGMDGLELVRRVRTMDHPPAVIMLTAYPDVATAVAALKEGAADYLQKPVDPDDLEITIRRCLDAQRLRQENRELKRDLASKYAFEKIIGTSPAMHELLETVRQVAPARSTVLVTGESGTGKELIARALHELSPRAHRPFVAVHCAALASNLLESELFGHERGAFTGASERRLGRFESADGGTLFLDEIGEIAPSVQVMLLRILETRTFERVGGNTPITVDVRLVVATNRDLQQMVAAGTFREDLYYRLDVLHLHLPPLRERPEDLPLLVHHYLHEFARENNKRVTGITSEALKSLAAHPWPGNVRELRNCIERMVVLSRGDTLTLKDVPDSIRNPPLSAAKALPAPASPARPSPALPVAAGAPAAVSPATAAGVPVGAAACAPPLDLTANERQLVIRALAECGGNRTAAAAKLGISRRTMHRKLHQFGLLDPAHGPVADDAAPAAEGPGSDGG